MVDNRERLKGKRVAILVADGFEHEELTRPRDALREAGAETDCHAPWMLIEAGVVEGRALTSYPSLASDLRNAGARWLDTEVVVDAGLVTSRKPDDIPAFSTRLIAEFDAARPAAKPAAVRSAR
jgi:putative intracellular protease/amidase